MHDGCHQIREGDFIFVCAMMAATYKPEKQLKAQIWCRTKYLNLEKSFVQENKTTQQKFGMNFNSAN